MLKARKQAQRRLKVAYVFFTLLYINLFLKLMGISTLNTAHAVDSTQALGMKISYFLFPILFISMAWFFMYLSKGKAVEANNLEISGSRWIDMNWSRW